MARNRAIFVAGGRQASRNVASRCRGHASPSQPPLQAGARGIPLVKSSVKSIRGFNAPTIPPEDHSDCRRGGRDLLLCQPEADGLAVAERALARTSADATTAAAAGGAQLDHIGAGLDLAQRDP